MNFSYVDQQLTVNSVAWMIFYSWLFETSITIATSWYFCKTFYLNFHGMTAVLISMMTPLDKESSEKIRQTVGFTVWY